MPLIDGKKSNKRPISGRGGPWSDLEVETLYNGIKHYGEGSWTAILDDVRFQHNLKKRTSCDLKDKWRSCCRKAKANKKDILQQPSKLSSFQQQLHNPKRKRSGTSQSKKVKNVTMKSVTPQKMERVAGICPSSFHGNSTKPSCSGRGGPWSTEEVEALTLGVNHYGEGTWRTILDDSKYSTILQNRTNADLKDKWRVMCRGQAKRQIQKKARSDLSSDILERQAHNEIDLYADNDDLVENEVEDGTLLDVHLPLYSEGAATALVSRVDIPLNSSSLSHSKLEDDKESNSMCSAFSSAAMSDDIEFYDRTENCFPKPQLSWSSLDQLKLNEGGFTLNDMKNFNDDLPDLSFT